MNAELPHARRKAEVMAICPGAGAELIRKNIDAYRTLGAFGAPAYQRHMHLRSMLQLKGGARRERLANYFAKPTFDADTGEIRWSTEVPGRVRSWADMTPQEQQRCESVLAELHEALQALLQTLRRDGGSQQGGAMAYAGLLEQAIKAPSRDGLLFFVGDQPVITFWAFESRDGKSVDPTAGPLRGSATDMAATRPDPAQRPSPGRAPNLDTTTLRAERPLAIPPGALQRGDLSFLEGLWQLGDDRLEAYQAGPDDVVGSHRYVLRFGRDGHGSCHATERLQRGLAAADCVGTLQARTDGVKLLIECGDCAVPGEDTPALQGARHECELDESGQTICYALNADGHRWVAPLRRLARAT